MTIPNLSPYRRYNLCSLVLISPPNSYSLKCKKKSPKKIAPKENLSHQIKETENKCIAKKIVKQVEDFDAFRVTMHKKDLAHKASR